LSDDEVHCLYCAYSVHDINKLVERSGKSFNALATQEAVQAELEKIGTPAFFPTYTDYLDDITTLVRAHSGHYHTAAELLIRTHNPYRLRRDRLERVLCPLMKALDTLELSTALTERDNKDAFLAFFNSMTDRQYAFVCHQVSEQRGLLTNLIHNQVSHYLEEHHQLTPLLFYPDGVAYLMDKARPLRLSSEDLTAIGQAVARKAAAMSRGNFAKFIKARPSGISVDRQCVELGVPFSDVIGVVYEKVMVKVVGRRFKIEEDEHKAREELQAAVGSLLDPHLVSTLEARLGSKLYPDTQVGMGAAELLRSYYIFLNAHCKKAVDGDVWQHLYDLLHVDRDAVAIYDLSDPLYRRAFLVAHDMNLETEALYDTILADGKRIEGDKEADVTAALSDYAVLAAYVARNVTFSIGADREVDFAAALRQYVENNHHQCCYCGSEFPTANMMAPQVPENVAVQSFSNRLPGGSSREPKRNLCDVCRVQFTIEKLTRRSMKGIKTVFLHLYPYAFYTDLFLVALRNEVQSILSEDISVVFPKTDDAFRALLGGGRVNLSFALRNRQGNAYQNGLALPQFSETIGNVLTFPLNCPGDNDAEQFIFALQNALLLQRFFGCRVLLTESAIPILSGRDFSDFFVDCIPSGFEGLLPRNDLDATAVATLWDDILASFSLLPDLYIPRGKKSQQGVLVTLVRSLAINRLDVFLTADLLLERRLQTRKTGGRQQDMTTQAIRRMMPHLNNLVKGGTLVERLRQLARIARDYRIRGSVSWRRNSVLDPLDAIFEALEGKSEVLELGTIQAALVEDIFKHIESTADNNYKPGRAKYDKVTRYIKYFFDEILDAIYHNNVQRLLTDRKTLRSAYLFYFNEQD
jgi:CRISPR-associated protein Csc3